MITEEQLRALENQAHVSMKKAHEDYLIQLEIIALARLGLTGSYSAIPKIFVTENKK